MDEAKSLGRVALVALALAGCGSSAGSGRADGGDSGTLDGADAAGAASDAEVPDAAASPDADALFDAVATPDAVASPDAAANGDDHPRAPMDAPDSLCSAPTELHDGDVLTDQRFGAATSVLPACDFEPARTPRSARWYRITVPAGGIVEVDARPENTPFTSVSVMALAGCDAAACVAGAHGDRDGTAALFHRNEGDAPETLLVAVTGGDDFPGDGAATVTARVRTPADNSTCATALPLAPDATLRGQDLTRATAMLTECLDNGGRNPGRALFYSITVPPRTVLVATARGTGTALAGGAAGVFIRPPCGVPGCLPNTFSLYGSAQGGQFNNTSDAPQEVSVIAWVGPGDASPAIDLTTTLRPLPANGSCAAAVALVAGTPTRVEHVEDATEPSAACAATGGLARALFYAVTVPAGQTLEVTARPASTPAFRPVVGLFTDCDGACLASAYGEDLPPRAVWPNQGPGARRIIVALGTTNNGIVGPTSLLATLRPSSPNLTCAGALPLTSGVPVTGIDPLEAQAASPCANVMGPVLYYAIPVTPGAVLSLGVSGYGPWWTPMAVISGCGGRCLAQSDSFGPTLIYTHHGAAQTVIVALGRPHDLSFLDTLTLSARVE